MILEAIAEATKVRVEKAKERLPLTQLKKMLYEEGNTAGGFRSRSAFAFEQALRKREAFCGNAPAKKPVGEINTDRAIAFICEIKKASPSKGIIAEDFPYLEIAEEYAAAGADAISVLTEPDYFKGDDRYLNEISRQVPVPVLRKDFVIDEYQIYEAKLIGADAVLLICSLLNTDTIRRYLKICDGLGLSALVEAHTKEEVLSAVEAGAGIIGVNNRNLQTFEVDLNNSIKLRALVPKNIIFVAESGIRTAEDIKALRAAGVDAVLVGELLMRSADKKNTLSSLRRL